MKGPSEKACRILTAVAICFSFSPLFAQDTPEPEPSQIPKGLQYIYTSERRPVPLSEETSSTTVIKKEEIKKQAQPMLFENLKESPGANILQSGTNGEEVNITLRGTSANQTMVLMDGIKLNSPFDQKFNMGNLLNLQDSSIEVVRGPQSAMYGSEAIGGAINIITEDPDPGNAEVFLRGGNLGTSYEEMKIKSIKNDYSLNLGLARMDSAGEGPRDAYRNTFFNANSKINISDKSTAKISSIYSKAYKSLPYDVTLESSPEPSLVFIRDANRDLFSDFFFTTASFASSPVRLYDYMIQGGIVWQNLTLNNPPDTGPGNIEFSEIDSKRLTFITQHNVKVLNHYSFSAGYEMTQDKLSVFLSDTYPPVYTKDEGDTRTDHAIYMQHHFDIGDDIKAKIGGRFDHISGFGVVLAPQASFGYNWKSHGVNFRANYGEGFRAPTYRELYLPEVGNRDLKEERSRSFDVGFKHDFIPNKISLDVAYFHNFFRNLIKLGDSLIYENISRAQSYGAESTIEIKPVELLVIRLNYAYTRALDTTTDPDTRLPLIPENNLNANINVKPMERMNLNLNVHFISDQQNITYSIPLYDSDGNPIGEKNSGYVKLDIAGSYDLIKNPGTIKKLELSLIINNLLNSRIFDLAGFKTAGINFLLGLKAGF